MPADFEVVTHTFVLVLLQLVHQAPLAADFITCFSSDFERFASETNEDEERAHG
jgi:hypothetical protein